MKELKKCSKCEEEKDLEEFNWLNKAKGYRKSWCKICTKEDNKQYRQKNKKSENKRGRLWRENNPERMKELNKQYFEDNPEYWEQRYQDNKEHHNEQCRRWAESNRDKVNAYKSKRRSKEKNQTPILTKSEKKKAELYYQIAQYLGEEWQVDHVIPISKGGSDHPDNLQILTKNANQRKHAKLDFIPKTLEYFRI